MEVIEEPEKRIIPKKKKKQQTSWLWDSFWFFFWLYPRSFIFGFAIILFNNLTTFKQYQSRQRNLRREWEGWRANWNKWERWENEGGERFLICFIQNCVTPKNRSSQCLNPKWTRNMHKQRELYILAFLTLSLIFNFLQAKRRTKKGAGLWSKVKKSKSVKAAVEKQVLSSLSLSISFFLQREEHVLKEPDDFIEAFSSSTLSDDIISKVKKKNWTSMDSCAGFSSCVPSWKRRSKIGCWNLSMLGGFQALWVDLKSFKNRLRKKPPFAMSCLS